MGISGAAEEQSEFCRQYFHYKLTIPWLMSSAVCVRPAGAERCRTLLPKPAHPGVQGQRGASSVAQLLPQQSPGACTGAATRTVLL